MTPNLSPGPGGLAVVETSTNKTKISMCATGFYEAIKRLVYTTGYMLSASP